MVKEERMGPGCAWRHCSVFLSVLQHGWLDDSIYPIRNLPLIHRCPLAQQLEKEKDELDDPVLPIKWLS